ncbi:hypothetical protein R80B4_03241 [Fibrobacteres bacterium R8-0-B4]
MYKRRKEFNVTGPCVPGDHYMLDPLRGSGGDNFFQKNLLFGLCGMYTT